MLKITTIRHWLTIFILTIALFGLSTFQIQAAAGTGIDATENLTNETFNLLNPLVIGGSSEFDPTAAPITPANLINRVLFFAFPIAGLMLLVMLLWSGFEMIAGATDKKAQDAGTQRATAAVIGFGLLFVSYWIIRLLEIVFGAKIF